MGTIEYKYMDYIESPHSGNVDEAQSLSVIST